MPSGRGEASSFFPSRFLRRAAMEAQAARGSKDFSCRQRMWREAHVREVLLGIGKIARRALRPRPGRWPCKRRGRHRVHVIGGVPRLIVTYNMKAAIIITGGFLNEINESAHHLAAEGIAATARTGVQGQ